MEIAVGDTIKFEVVKYQSHYQGDDFVPTGKIRIGKVVRIKNEDYFVVHVIGYKLPYIVHRDNIIEE